MIRILSHLKVFELKKNEPTQGLDTWSRFRGENREKLNGSNFEPSQGFRTRKSEPTQGLGTWSRFRRENKEKLNGSNFEPSQSYAWSESRVIDLLRWLFEPSQGPPRISSEPILGRFQYGTTMRTVLEHPVPQFLSIERILFKSMPQSALKLTHLVHS